MSNVAEALEEEIARNRKLLELYKTIPTGAFGAMMIEKSISEAVDALASQDVVRIVTAYESIKNNE